MSIWTDELKAKVIEMYTSEEPTADTSTEIIKDIAEELGQSPNGVRQVLSQAGVYVKKTPAASKTTKTKTESGEGSKRVSKESQIGALRDAINAAGAEVDEEILSKLTGKAAAYFVTVLSAK